MAAQIRIDAANFQHSIPLPDHPDNGDEARYAGSSYFASYSKGLPHNSDNAGLVDPIAYQQMVSANQSGDPAQYEAIPLGGSRQLVNPQSAYSYVLEGADPQALAIRPAPTFDSLESAGEMEELYWMALARDVSFDSYTSSNPPALITDAIASLSAHPDFRGPKQGGVVTGNTLFRGNMPGATQGPYISQFLLQDIPYGVQVIQQQNRTRIPGDDAVSNWSEWLYIQQGNPPYRQPQYDTTRRYLRNGRDLAEFVHSDVPLQETLNAALLMIRQNGSDVDPKASPPIHDENNPYRSYTKQEPFITFGNSDGLDLAIRSLNTALRAEWYQKWLVHRRLRPEEFGGRVHSAVRSGINFPVNPELLSAPVLGRIAARNAALNGDQGAFLLPQAYPEGSPLHPSYASGHSTYIGAGVTMLKAFYKVDAQVPNPVQPSSDGLSLVPYTGAPLLYVDELDKLASNIGMARLFAGVHYRSDHEYGIRLGELSALRMLQDMARTYHEPFAGFQVRTFDGNTLTITATSPPLPNHVNAVVSFSLINADTGQPIAGFDPILNGAVLNLNALPTRNLNIRANTYEATVGSVRFNYDGNAPLNDNGAPYTLAGDSGGTYLAFTPTVGVHVLTATPFHEANGAGLGGVPLTLRFTVIQPTAPTRIEAEQSYTVVSDVGSTPIAVVDAAQDSGRSVKLPDAGDAIQLSANVSTTGVYRLSLRVRSGDQTNPARYWFPQAYEIKVDGTVVSSFGSTTSFSAYDSTVSGPFGTLNADVQLTGPGSHQIQIKALVPNLWIDFLDVTSGCIPTSDRTEVELNSVVLNDVGTQSVQIEPYPGRVWIIDPGDTIRTSFTVGAAGYYRLQLRAKSNNPAEAWDLSTYEIKVNGAANAVPLHGDPSSVSGPASPGTLSFDTPLNAGVNYIDIKALTSWLNVDYLDAPTACAQ